MSISELYVSNYLCFTLKWIVATWFLIDGAGSYENKQAWSDKLSHYLFCNHSSVLQRYPFYVHPSLRKLHSAADEEVLCEQLLTLFMFTLNCRKWAFLVMPRKFGHCAAGRSFGTNTRFWLHFFITTEITSFWNNTTHRTWWWGAGTGCPEAVVPHPCRQPRSGWMGLWTLIELWVSLFMGGGLDQMAFTGPFQLNLMILWYKNTSEHPWHHRTKDSSQNPLRQSASMLCWVQHVTLWTLFLFPWMQLQTIFLAFIDTAQVKIVLAFPSAYMLFIWWKARFSLSPLTAVNTVNHGFEVRPMSSIMKPHFLF